jgi:hypothetical protein
MFRTVVTVLALTIAVFLLLPGRSETLSVPNQETRRLLETGHIQEALRQLETRIANDPQDLESRRELVRVVTFQAPASARPVLAEQFKGVLGTQELDYAWFLSLARHPEAVVRTNVVTCIGDAHIESGFGAAKRLANDRNKEVRVAATRALGELAEENGRFTLLCALKDGEWLIRSTAANGLGRLKPDSRTTRSLFRAMEDSDEYVRFWALKSLMAQYNPQNAKLYQGYLNNEAPRQRMAALLAMAHGGNREVLPDLCGLLVNLEGKDRDLGARTLARKAPEVCRDWLNSPIFQDGNVELAKLLRGYLSDTEVEEENILAGSAPGAL